MNNITNTIPLTVSSPKSSEAWDAIKKTNEPVIRFKYHGAAIRETFKELHNASASKETALNLFAAGVVVAIPSILLSHLPLAMLGVALVVISVVKLIFAQNPITTCRQNKHGVIQNAAQDFFATLDARLQLLQNKIAANEPIDFKQEIEKLRFLHYTKKMFECLNHMHDEIAKETTQDPKGYRSSAFNRSLLSAIRVIVQKIQNIETCLETVKNPSKEDLENFHEVTNRELNDLIEEYKKRKVPSERISALFSYLTYE